MQVWDHQCGEDGKNLDERMISDVVLIKNDPLLYFKYFYV